MSRNSKSIFLVIEILILLFPAELTEYHFSEDPCTDGFTFNAGDNYCYKLIRQVMTWTGARNNCLRLHGDLAKIDNPCTKDFITQLVESDSGIYDYWIGLNDIQVENKFRWTDYSPMSFGYFPSDQPNGGTRQNCIIHGETWSNTLHDKTCQDFTESICQRRPDYSSRLLPWVKMETTLVSHRHIIQHTFVRSVLECAKLCQPEDTCDVFIFRYNNNTSVDNCFVTSFSAETADQGDWTEFVTYRRQLL